MRAKPAWSSIECPTCGAAPGESCRTIHGIRTDPHNPRVREAAAS
ncbi:MAG TPA: hypothetical protein VM370_09735 [Candidatus Thermoplasmatota archaeon]|nr:hypothetical protein [Candidatus Thermoplasmatota archaeon]